MAPQLNTRCEKIETATQDLLKLLFPKGMTLEDMATALEPKSGTTTPGRFNTTSHLSMLAEEEEDLKPGEATQQRETRRRQDLYQEANCLLVYFNKNTMDALLRCTRMTLESLKRRVTSPSTLSYGDDDRNKKHDSRPAFRVKLVLSIPQVSLKPSIEDIQNTVNTIVQRILAVHKHVNQWGQVSTKSLGAPSTSKLAAQSKVLSPTSPIELAQASAVLANSSANRGAPGTFFKLISEHKDIAKLVSVLSSTISSAKGLVNQSLDRFKVYEHLWTLDRDEHMKTFLLAGSPGLSEFESEIRKYMQLEETISEEIEEELTVGALALITGECIDRRVCYRQQQCICNYTTYLFHPNQPIGSVPNLDPSMPCDELAAECTTCTSLNS